MRGSRHRAKVGSGPDGGDRDEGQRSPARGAEHPLGLAARARLLWVDALKGIAILWIAYFHFFKAWANERYPAPFSPDYLSTFFAQCAPAGGEATAACAGKAVFVAFSLLGFHAVSVFLIVSGFGLTHSLVTKFAPGYSWRGWYRARLLRLFPMYWVAHGVIALSPFVWLAEPIDGRFWLSIAGDRIWPVESMFFYLNAAWWYFGLLLQLYLVFPLLFLLLRRIGPRAFLFVALLTTLGVRHLLLSVYPVNGNWVQGAFFGSRLFEFAAGMALGVWHQREPSDTERRLFGAPALMAGVVLYGLGLASYANIVTYVATDALVGSGLFLLLAHLAHACAPRPRLGLILAQVGAYSYGLYLVHQPYAIYFATLVRSWSIPAAIAAFLPVLAVLTVLCMALERLVNRATTWFFAPTPARAPAEAGAGSGPQ